MADHDDPERPRASRHMLLRALLRPLLTVSLLLLAYFVLPMGELADAGAVAFLVGGAIFVVALCGWQVWRILRSPVPGLRAAEALAVTVPAYLLGSATAVFVLGQADPAAFTQSLTRIDALYFTVTVFATVGFGDITAADQAARLLTTAMMVGNLVMLAVGVRLLVAAGKWGRARRHRDAPD
ncbi:potassium channel family protein [Prescottella sp. R16]|uniref:potassium channel family protein n=1 Tax=Prescottella sp. R16 TaxID=3064529 RepID=UPI00272E4A48|nr:potassium channel family protein [Prescottella sp. R16]